MANKLGRTEKKRGKINLDENSRLHIMAVSTATYAATVDLVFYRLLLYIYTDFSLWQKILFEISSENPAPDTDDAQLYALYMKVTVKLVQSRVFEITTYFYTLIFFLKKRKTSWHAYQ